MQEVRLGKTASRSVLGIMNEFTFLAQTMRGDTTTDLTDLARWLARTPCSPLFKRHGGTVNLRSCGRSANHISLIRHTRPGESRRRTGENRPRIAQVDSASGGLAGALGVSESTVSHHLTQLRNAGLVESERRGMNVYHRPRRDALTALCMVLDPNCCI